MHHTIAPCPLGIAFVDIETAGGYSQRDSITGIGIIAADENGVRECCSSRQVRPMEVLTWSQLHP